MKPTSRDANLQFMPVKADKTPIHKKWEQTKCEYDYSNAEAVGLVCGGISGNLECIDIDSKYDLSGTMFNEYKKTVNDIDPTLLKKLVVQKTVNGGYHFIYRCDVIEGNRKLASRYATQEEKLKGDKIKVLFETRGEHGYIACVPTNGYKFIHKDFDSIEKITPEQRQILFDVAFTFNEVVNEYKPIHTEKKNYKGLTPFEDYNDRADVVELLVKHGWTVFGRKGAKILMRRPGDTKAKQSGNYDEEKKWFSVFSTSTEFESQKPYQPYAVYGVLECNKDWSETGRRLYAEGYGDRKETVTDNHIVIPSVIDLTDDDYSFLATPEDYENYLERWRTGTFEMGKSTGIPELDKHYLFKEGDLVIINGIDNVGKSTVIWYLATLSNVLHGWKWLIFSSENKIGSVVRKLIEFYWSEPILGMPNEKYQKGKKWVAENFDIIKCSDRLYNYQDILNMTTKAMKKREYKGLMIDPYNSLKVDIPAKSKQQTYDYHYEAASVLQLFGKNHNLSIYLNCHVGTPGARNKDKSGYTKAPQKEDTEMGVMFANKADQFLTIHRVTQHPTEWMFTEIHVRKVKETETGGRVTPYAQPVSLRMVQGSCGFAHTITRTLTEVGLNPILNFHGIVKPFTPPEPTKDQKLKPNHSFYETEKEVEITADQEEEGAPLPF